jgi:hypothetical protein
MHTHPLRGPQIRCERLSPPIGTTIGCNLSARRRALRPSEGMLRLDRPAQPIPDSSLTNVCHLWWSSWAEASASHRGSDDVVATDAIGPEDLLQIPCDLQSRGERSPLLGILLTQTVPIVGHQPSIALLPRLIESGQLI